MVFPIQASPLGCLMLTTLFIISPRHAAYSGKYKSNPHMHGWECGDLDEVQRDGLGGLGGIVAGTHILKRCYCVSHYSIYIRMKCCMPWGTQIELLVILCNMISDYARTCTRVLMVANHHAYRHSTTESEPLHARFG